MVKLDLALERLDGGIDFALARDDRQHRPDGLASIRRQDPLVGGLTAGARPPASRRGQRPPRPRGPRGRAPATPAVTADAASTPKTVLRSNAAAIQPTASTASQPTNSAATPARPKVMTRSRRRGASLLTTAIGAGSLGVTRSVRSVGMIRGANGRCGATWSAASTSITRAMGA